jgi:hypothetical protein
VVSVISDADPRDSGVYTCVLFEKSGSHTVISVITLAVKPHTPTLSTRETWHITLHCHGEVLGYVYRDLSQKWELNGTLWKDYGLTTLTAVSGTNLVTFHLSFCLTEGHLNASLFSSLGSFWAPSKILNTRVRAHTHVILILSAKTMN